MDKQSVNDIWSLTGIKGITVIDFGVGESTEKLVKLGAYVIAIDRNLDKIKQHKTKLKMVK